MVKLWNAVTYPLVFLLIERGKHRSTVLRRLTIIQYERTAPADPSLGKPVVLQVENHKTQSAPAFIVLDDEMLSYMQR